MELIARLNDEAKRKKRNWFRSELGVMTIRVLVPGTGVGYEVSTGSPSIENLGLVAW
jgi:hypothetical protein